jgi:hypothetical protein
MQDTVLNSCPDCQADLDNALIKCPYCGRDTVRIIERFFLAPFDMIDLPKSEH